MLNLFLKILFYLIYHTEGSSISNLLDVSSSFVTNTSEIFVTETKSNGNETSIYQVEDLRTSLLQNSTQVYMSLKSEMQTLPLTKSTNTVLEPASGNATVGIVTSTVFKSEAANAGISSNMSSKMLIMSSWSQLSMNETYKLQTYSTARTLNTTVTESSIFPMQSLKTILVTATSTRDLIKQSSSYVSVSALSNFTSPDIIKSTTEFEGSILMPSSTQFHQPKSYFITTSKSLLQTLSIFSVTQTPTPSGTPCVSCNKIPTDDKEFLYMMLGIGIGAAFFIFVTLLLVSICIRRHRKRGQKVDDRNLTDQGLDDLFRSKDSIFSSSTLQLNRGLSNDGLELEMFHNPTPSDRFPKFSSFQPEENTDSQSSPNNISIEIVDVRPSPPSQQGLDDDLELDASIKLLQEWDDDLDDNDSEMYKELKRDVEDSIKYIYQGSEGFKDVHVKSFRHGSIIADLALIMLAAVVNPLEILEQSVLSGVIGNLRVDHSYSVRGSGNTEDEISILHKRQPYLKRILFGGAVENRSKEYGETSCVNSDIEDTIHATQEAEYHALPDDSMVDGPTKLDGSDLRLGQGDRPQSLVDLRNASSNISLREARDSGIGSMQELCSNENRFSRSEVSVFYDIPESSEVPQYENSATVTAEDSPSPEFDDGVPHVALYEFVGENDRELSIKQGEVVHVINKESSGWVKVKNGDEKQGWVPTSFLVHVSQSQLADTIQTVETLEFFDNVLDELEEESVSGSSAASTPEDVAGAQTEPNDEIYDIPEDSSEYVELIPEKNLEIQVKHCKSVYRFDGSDSNELSFVVGQIISVLKTTDIGWWKGRVGENEGWFPSSYVMPLNEESEIEKKSSINYERINKEPRRHSVPSRSSEKTGLDPIMQPRPGSAIYEEPKSNLKRTDHTYQSLQRGLRSREDYAHLYVQILQRESNENIPKSCEILDVDAISNESNRDRPHRLPPVPPKEDKPNKPLLPPKDQVTDKKVKPLVPKPRKIKSSHGDPPKRPVPPPPTAKPSLAHLSVIRTNRANETIFLDNTISGQLSPPSRSKYENMPEKPRHSPEFLLRQAVKKPIQVISLNCESIQSESSTDFISDETFEEADNDEGDSSCSKHAPPRKALPILEDTNDKLKMESSIRIPTTEEANVTKRPTKPLPRLRSKDSESSPVISPTKTNGVGLLKVKSSKSSSNDKQGKPLLPKKPIGIDIKERKLDSPSKRKPPDRPEMPTAAKKLVKQPKSLDMHDSKKPIPVKRQISYQSSEFQTKKRNFNQTKAQASVCVDSPNPPKKPVSQDWSPEVRHPDIRQNDRDQQEVASDIKPKGKTDVSITTSPKNPQFKPGVPKKPVLKTSSGHSETKHSDVGSLLFSEARSNEAHPLPETSSDSEKVSRPIPSKRPGFEKKSSTEQSDKDSKTASDKRSKPFPVPRKKPARSESGDIDVAIQDKEDIQKKKPARPPPPNLEDSPKISSLNLISPKTDRKDKSKVRRVIKPYKGSSNKELELKIGELVYELDAPSGHGTCFGLLETGEQGWYPTDHVEKI